MPLALYAVVEKDFLLEINLHYITMGVKNIEKSSHSIEMVTDFVHRLQKMRTKVAETLSDVGYLLNEALLLKQALEENADVDGRKSSEFQSS